MGRRNLNIEMRVTHRIPHLFKGPPCCKHGKGAGKLPTASAVVSDIIDAIRANDTIKTLQWDDGDENLVEPFDSTPVSCYVRISGIENLAAKTEVLFGDVQSIASPKGELAFITPKMTEGELKDKLNALRENDIKVLGAIRVLDY